MIQVETNYWLNLDIKMDKMDFIIDLDLAHQNFLQYTYMYDTNSFGLISYWKVISHL